MKWKILFSATSLTILSLSAVAQQTLTLNSPSVPAGLKTYLLEKFAAESEDFVVVKLGDIDADNKDDFLITVNNSTYCGTAGCVTELLLSAREAQYVEAYSGNLHELTLDGTKAKGGVRFNALGHASMCAASGPVVCELVLELKENKLVILEGKVKE